MMQGTALPGILAAVIATKTHLVLPPVPRVLLKSPLGCGYEKAHDRQKYTKAGCQV